MEKEIISCPKEASKLILMKMKDEGISREEIIALHNDMTEEKFDCMISGDYPYSDVHDQVASKILGILVRAQEKYYDEQYSFRKDKKASRDEEFEEILNNQFEEIISKHKASINFEHEFKSISEFRKIFEINLPIGIKEFLEINKEKDNFIIIIDKNDLGISGMTKRVYREGVGYNCIYINSKEPLGRQNFTFFHEIYHIYFEKSYCLNQFHVIKEQEFEIESDAQKFASEIVLRISDLLEYLKKNNFSCHKTLKKRQVFPIQKHFGATFQAIAYKIYLVRKSVEKLECDEKKKRSVIKYIPKVKGDLLKYCSKDSSKWLDIESEIRKVDPSNIYNFSTNKRLVLTNLR